ncbi:MULTISPECIES: Mor transcription activator family protein [Acinetobacter]|uniref:Mor transcription activator family protein n=1 Tax=Acinetobacter faecalis TaxID=2665161 RepID=A0ABU5GJP9_9GAMM|nr:MULTISPECIES: Mor transcription activator family protein [Acinetobacter]MDY6550762.1 Mor transcription activator family protein [Acinetobacter faecalis]
MESIDDLNGDLRSIAEVIGRHNALYLVSQCPRYKTEKRAGQGQLFLYVPTLKRLEMNHFLVKTLGYPDAEKLSKEFGGELLVLAQCKQIILRARDNGIREMIRVGFNVNDLVNIFNASERVVSRIYEAELCSHQMTFNL